MQIINSYINPVFVNKNPTVMPYSIYASLNLGPLEEIGIVTQLADRSNIRPKGILEDVLVQVENLVFPADFYVIEMGKDMSPNSTPILLGRPFLKTAQTKIDVHKGSLSMEFEDERINFNIFEDMKHQSENIHTLCEVKVLNNDNHGSSTTKGEVDKGKTQSQSVNSFKLTTILSHDVVKRKNKTKRVWRIKKSHSGDAKGKPTKYI